MIIERESGGGGCDRESVFTLMNAGVPQVKNG